MELTSLISGNDYLLKAIKIFLFFFLYLFGKEIVFLGIDFTFKNIEKTSLSTNYQRLLTLKKLLKNLVRYLLLFVFLFYLLEQFGINLTPFITGIGILGLAFSFGAQTLVKDLIAGFFIVLENQYNVGDLVQLNDQKGEVVKITLRLTVLKDKHNNLIYLPNAQINKVIVFSNKMSKDSPSKGQSL